MSHRTKINTMLFIVAIVSVFVFLYAKNGSSLLQANVLATKEKTTIENNKWDIAYKNENNLFQIFVGDEVKNIDTLTLSITYDPETIVLKQADPKGKYTIDANEKGNLILTFKNISGVNINKNLLALPFSGKEPNILLSEGTMRATNGEQRSLAIGVLNQPKQYH